MQQTPAETAKLIAFFAYLGLLFAVPHQSGWFGLVLLVPLLLALVVAGQMLSTGFGVRREAAALARQPPLRALQTRERNALDWFGEPGQISWRTPRGNVIDLAAAVRRAGDDKVVRRIRGPWSERVRGRHHDRHTFIGPVQVLLLPGADRHLAPDNEAEVLLCGNFAVVLSLNGRWRVDQARGWLR